MTTIAPPAADDRWPVQRCNAPECGADIIFAFTVAGKRTPVDVEPAPGGTIQLIPGPPVAAIVVPAHEAKGRTDLRMSHFATCAKPGRFRRSG